ncbi:paraquat-inducible protein A [Paraferrimonas sp. SM1919]|uniref:paraquat-inducible protein A n=1 Tax=Paraferrimonas sp. SM1919 TaxID=2662263 RepID=UPI0013D78576|nr:paraquat-inducible protein A [Paraferrimonas sp. SM1919]
MKSPTREKLLLCRHCDKVLNWPTLKPKQRAICPRCHSSVLHYPISSLSGLGSLAWAALFIFFPANLLPILEIHFFGSIRLTTITGAALEVWHQGFWLVAIAVICSAVVAPLLLIVSVIIQVQILKQDSIRCNQADFLRRLFKWHKLLTQLTMLEIYLISFLVSVFKLSDFADVHFGYGTLSFGLLFIFVLYMQREYSTEAMWQEFEKRVDCEA